MGTHGTESGNTRLIGNLAIFGHGKKAQKTATKKQMYFQQNRKCKIDKTATFNSKSATSSVSVIHRLKTRSKYSANALRRKAISNAPNIAELIKLAASSL